MTQSKAEYPDQDYLDLAEINLRKFNQDFPGEEKLAVADHILQEMKEVFASDLYDTARFYERTSKPHAARLYYTRILAKYPETKVAQLSNKRLGRLQAKLPAVKEPGETPQPASIPPSPLLQLPASEGVTVDAGEPQATEEPVQ